MFSVSVHFDHNFYFKTHTSKNTSQIADAILDEIKERSKHLFLFFNWMSLLTSFMFLWIFLRAIIYRNKFLLSDRFDNYYITKNFIKIDEQRKKLNKDSVLPLTRKEGNKYARPNSCILLRSEKLKLIRSIIFLIISSIQLLSIIIIDYSFYWLLSTIRRYGSKQSGLETPEILTLSVTGKGMIAELYDGIIEAFEPMTKEYYIDPIPCLPDPFPPDFQRNYEIGGFLILCWILLFFEPFGLRLRQIVMNSYYPNRSNERAVWLYNYILRKRETFVKIARRQARKQFLKDKTENDKVEDFMDVVRAKTNQ